MDIPQRQTPPVKTCSSCQAVVESDYWIDKNPDSPTYLHWMIKDKDTGIRAQGPQGEIGTAQQEYEQADW